MPATALSSTSFLYESCDVAEGQTLVEWRRDRELARRDERRTRRPFTFRHGR